MPELPLFVPKAPPASAPGFQMRLPQPSRWSRWKKPSAWILPLALVLAALVFLVAYLPTTPVDDLPPIDDRLPTIVIDAGHGGHDAGASHHGLREKDLALDTALRLERQLRLRGFPVVLTRRDDRFLPLFDRSAIANALPFALFVSVHYNDSSTAAGEGVETFYAQHKAGWLATSYANAGGVATDCGTMAQCVQNSMIRELRVPNRGAKARQLAVVRYSRWPAVLVEGGFLNNPAEARKIAEPAYRDRIAESVANGIAAYQQQREQLARETRLAQH